MVSFFGRKLGAAKKKKESADVIEHSLHHQEWKKRIDQNTQPQAQQQRQHLGLGLGLGHGVGSGSSLDLRPGTANSIKSTKRPLDMPETHKLMANSMYDLAHAEFKGIGRDARFGSSASVNSGADPNPGPGLVPGSSSRLKPYASDANLRPSIDIMEDLAAARHSRFGGASRPGSSQSMRNSVRVSSGKQWVSPLDVYFGKHDAPQPRPKPTREMRPPSPILDLKQPPKSPLGDGPRSRTKSDASSLAPPKSPLGEYELKSPVKSDSASLFGDEPDKIAQDMAARIEEEARNKAAAEQQARVQAEREAQAKRNARNARNTDANKAARGYPSPPKSLRGDEPAPAPRPRFQILADDMTAGSLPGRSQSHGNASPGLGGPAASQAPRPREPMRGATVPGPKARPPMFHEPDSFDDEASGKEEPIADARTLDDGRYGIPSPPLSNGQRSSIEDNEPQPVIRNIEARRDTLMVGERDRQRSLDMKIEELEKTLVIAQMQQGHDQLQQLQPLSAVVCDSRRNSTSSSHYSDGSESPTTTFDPPEIMSPRFPLAPRPQSPVFKPRPMAPRRPTLDEYGAVKLSNAHPGLSGGVRRPSPDEYGSVPVRRTESPAPMAGRRDPSDDQYGGMKPLGRTESPAAMSGRRRPSADQYGGGLPVRRTESPAPKGGMREPSLDEYRGSRRTESPAPRSGVRGPSVDTYRGVNTRSRTNSSANIASPYTPRARKASDPPGPGPVEPDWAMDPPRVRIQGGLSATGSPSNNSNSINNTVNTPFSPPPQLEQDLYVESSRSSSPPESSRQYHYDVGALEPEPTISPQPQNEPPQPITTWRKCSPSEQQQQQQQQAAWDMGPAPTPAPTAPLPIPERVNRRDTAAPAKFTTTKRQEAPSPKPDLPTTKTTMMTTTTTTTMTTTSQSSTSSSTKSRPPSLLAPSATIVPDTESNPNWPLPAPSPTFSQARTTESLSSPRRQSRRGPPAPINIAATRYADAMGFGATSGTWTPDVSKSYRGGEPIAVAARPKTAGGNGAKITVHREFEWNEARAKFERPEEKNEALVVPHAIGLARGLSIRHDKVWQREQEQERKRKKAGLAKGMGMGSMLEERAGAGASAGIVTVTGTGTGSALNSPTAAGFKTPTALNSPTLMSGEPFDRATRPNQGLRSPTGIADEHGTGFI